MQNLQIKPQVRLGSELFGTFYLPQLGCQSTPGWASEWTLADQTPKLEGGARAIGQKD